MDYAIYEPDLETMYAALESEAFFIDSLLDDYVYDIATEADKGNGATVTDTMKNIGSKIVEFLKKVWEYIPKLFHNVVTKIKHCSIATQIRAKMDMPADLKNLPDDKVRYIKQKRVEILTAKQQLLEAADKMMSEALSAADTMSQEMAKVLATIRAGGRDAANLERGKFAVNEQTMNNMRNKFVNINKAYETAIRPKEDQLDKSLSALRDFCDTKALYAISVPIYKGQNHAEEYTNKLNSLCPANSKLVQELEPIVTNYQKAQQSMWTRERHLTRTAQKNAENANENGIRGLIVLYQNLSKQFLQTSKIYNQVCVKVFDAPEIPNQKGDYTAVVNDVDNTGAAAKNIKGTLSWDKKQKCWIYTRTTTSDTGRKVVLKVPLLDARNKHQQPPISANMEKQLDAKLAQLQKQKILPEPEQKGLTKVFNFIGEKSDKFGGFLNEVAKIFDTAQDKETKKEYDNRDF